MSSNAESHHSSHGGGGGMLVGLIPWILFTLIAEHGALKTASVAACLFALGICAYSIRSGGRPKALELAAAVVFAGFIVIAFVADASVSHWLTRYGRAIAAGLLSLVAFGSLLRVPFTEPGKYCYRQRGLTGRSIPQNVLDKMRLFTCH